MNGDPQDYHIIQTKNLKEALTYLADSDTKWTPLAGGTDLMVLLAAGLLPTGNYLSIWDLPELNKIHIEDDSIVIGAGITFQEILTNQTIKKEFSMLTKAAEMTGSVAIQSRATIGGNIANASPAADTPPALLCYDAIIEVTSIARGRIDYDYATFHLDYKKMQLKKDELITAIKLPRSGKPHTDYYHKVGTREAQAISKICFAARAYQQNNKVDDIRLAYASVAPIPLRARETEFFLMGKVICDQVIEKACTKLAAELSPLDDIRSTAAYRKKVAANLLREFLCGIGQKNYKS